MRNQDRDQSRAKTEFIIAIITNIAISGPGILAKLLKMPK